MCVISVVGGLVYLRMGIIGCSVYLYRLSDFSSSFQ
jgi:hypothetical protein